MYPFPPPDPPLYALMKFLALIGLLAIFLLGLILGMKLASCQESIGPVETDQPTNHESGTNLWSHVRQSAKSVASSSRLAIIKAAKAIVSTVNSMKQTKLACQVQTAPAIAESHMDYHTAKE